MSALPNPPVPPRGSLPRLVAAPTAEQLAAIEHARRRFGRVRRAATVARFSGWSLAIFAGLTILTGFMHLDVLALGAALGGIAFVELRGARAFRRLDDRAAWLLAANQAALAVLLVGWCLYRIVGVLVGPGDLARQLDPGSPVLRSAQSIDQLTATLTALIYGVMLAVVLCVQFGMVVYYATRGPGIRSLRRETEPWVLEFLGAAAGR